MQIRIETVVATTADETWRRFNQTLFAKLAPPFPRLKVLKFEGCEEGDEVAAELNFFLFKQRWTSRIVESGENESGYWFVDEGIELPFFLARWRHRHEIKKHSRGTAIVDDIEYHSPSGWMDYLLFPAMWLQFAYRKPIYRRFFRQS